MPCAGLAASGCDADEHGCRTPLERLRYGPEPAMSRNIDAASRVLERDVPILLYGETGTGKEMFAKALHQSSRRASQPFVAINCASIPESLIESELFGYKSGAFTGASKEGQRGKIFQANGGTLFLDEIGDMPLHLQARMLRALQERAVSPLGSNKLIQVDVAVVCATHRNMREMVEPHMEIIDKARAAFEACGVKPLVQPIRGGTDGARLSFMGLPCPNLSTGGYNFHGRKELISVQAMEKMVEVLESIVTNA